MNAVIYLEGGGDSKELHARCREGFRKLLERCSFKGRMPRLVACGGRETVFADFNSALAGKHVGYVAMWLDSEHPLTDLNATWTHLLQHDGWSRPEEASDEQVLFMTTCMETWLVADHAALREHFGNELQESALPPLQELEQRSPHDVQNRLGHATRNCSNPYTKGKRSFELLGKVEPNTLKKHLPSFARNQQILHEKL